MLQDAIKSYFLAPKESAFILKTIDFSVNWKMDYDVKCC